MEKKYPVLKCNKELWDEIKPVLESWGISGFKNVDKWSTYPYLLSNYGCCKDDIFKIEACSEHNTEAADTLRYLVSTKDEFLESIAKLLGKEYKPKKQFENKCINKDNMGRINIAEKLKNCPKGFKLYSKIHGDVKLIAVRNDTIYVTVNHYDTFFDKFGIYDIDFPDGECLLFPSKEQQDWNKFHSYIEEGHRVMCSDSDAHWHLKEYYEDNNAFDLGSGCYKTWKYIVPVEDFDFQAEDLRDNIKKSIV